MTVVVTHTTPADSTFSSTGAAAWNADHALSGVGTMAEQNANNVAITGGTIDNTVIGGTTPAAGTFTTLTAQTEFLNGTAQNFILYSQDFTNAYWTKTAVTNTANTTTAPDGTSTASTVTPAASTAVHELNTSPTLAGYAGYTVTAYVKNNGYQYCYFNFGGLGGGVVGFNLGTVSTYSVGSTILNSSITSVGNGWFRVSATAGGTFFRCDLGITSTAVTGSSTTNGTSGMFVWGFQLEYGFPARTYQVTTTTSISGTFPTLNFGGVSRVGVDLTGAMYLQPAGTGAIQAQATTSSIVGGNARGNNSVDWQTSRNGATQVASGSGAFIGGGTRNSSTGGQSVVSGGFGNTASGGNQPVVAGGGVNTANSTNYPVVVGGFSNNATNDYTFIGGGSTNTAAGFFNFIGAGQTNSGTSGSAVTTQGSTITSGSTAVTLSGSNASIKVGQLISGTGITSSGSVFNYVAAISGTSLTLATAAAANGTPTLSFFTPHGVVVGGGNNQATGAYSVILGGGDAGTAANRNVASGDWSVVVGGVKNVASGLGGFVGGGGILSQGQYFSNTASGISSSISGGFNNTASGNASTIVGGASHIANSQGAVIGGARGSTRGMVGYIAFPACVIPIQDSYVSQAGLLVLGRQTTDATATVLCSDFNGASTANQVILPNNSAYYFKGSVIANVTGAANGAAWSIEGAIMRGANAASTVLIDTPSVNRVAASSGASAWVVAVTADTTNGGLAVTVTGAASTTIRWVASLSTAEVTF